MARTIRRDSFGSHVLHQVNDVACIWAAWVCAYLVKERLHLGIPTDPFSSREVAFTFGSSGLLWLTVAGFLGTYAYKRRFGPEIVGLALCVAVTLAFFLTAAYATRIFVYPRWMILLFAVFGITFLTVSRAVKELLRRWLMRRGRLLRRVLIIGDGPTGRRLAAFFRAAPAAGYRFVGFVTEGPLSGVAGSTLGTVEELQSILESTAVDEVIVALPGHRHERIADIADRCLAYSVRLRIVPDLMDVIMVRATVGELDGIPLIGLRDPVISGAQSWAKRSFDIVVASLLLLVTLPAWVFVAVCIALDSRGRVLYSAERAGENGQPFRMYKFRTMRADADEQLDELLRLEDLPEPAFKLRDDPRVTRVGRWLRRTSLDELPQLINVLRGDMSMVGPRPEDMRVVAYYNRWHRKRLAVKPGLTGPMQVSGRADLPLDERIRLELMYISRYSLLEDVKYLLKTVPAVVRGKGAY